MESKTHQLIQLFLLQTTKTTEVARESMTSDASQTSMLTWQQEDARSIHCNIYPLYTALLSDWRVRDSSPLTYLRERTCEVDIGAFLHFKEFEDLLRALGLHGIAKAGELVKMKRWKLIPIQKGALESPRRDFI